MVVLPVGCIPCSLQKCSVRNRGYTNTTGDQFYPNLFHTNRRKQNKYNHIWPESNLKGIYPLLANVTLIILHTDYGE